MSARKNRYQAERWLDTARDDLRAAETLREAEMYAQACFLAQQAGEKAVKAVWYLHDREPWGRSIQKLLQEFPHLHSLVEPEKRIEQAALLDQFYVPTRYPSGLPDLTPGEVYRRADAERGIDAATEILAACAQLIEDVRTDLDEDDSAVP